MGTLAFDMPKKTHEVLHCLNSAHCWSLSVLAERERIHVLNSNVVVFTADTEQEVEAFLAGIYAASAAWATGA